MSKAVRTTCPYCGVGCGLVVEKGGSETWVIKGDPVHPSNTGRLCSKGTALGETIAGDGCSLSPSLDGKAIGWEQALDLAAHRFRETIDRHGPDSVAFYVSGQLLTEDYYVANKLMKGFIGSGNIDTNSRLCMSSSVAGHKRAFGSDTVPGCYEDFELAELIVLTGSNTAWCHPVLYRRIAQAKENNPALKVVVIDPRQTATCEIADLHLQLKPGSDSLLFSGLLNYLERNQAINHAFVESHTEGMEESLQQAQWYAPSARAVAELCGLAEDDLLRFYRWYLTREQVVTLYSQGINQSSSGTDKVNAIINCHLLTGRIGRPGMGPFSITGQPNAMGGREVGALCNQLACHMDIENSSHRELVGRFWNTQNLAAEPGLTAVDLFRAVEAGEVKALWIMATNPAVSIPDGEQVRRALAKCEFVVVSDCVRETDTSSYADLFLPAQGWGEKDGTVTNSERTISRQRRFLSTRGDARPDWWILSRVAQHMGYPGFDYSAPSEIFNEYARLSGFENGGQRDFDISGLAGLSQQEYDSLAPLQWPVTSTAGKGTRRLFGDGRFFTPSGRGRFIPVIPRAPGEALSVSYPLVLNTGRVRDQWHTMTRTGRSARLFGHDSEPFAEIHPYDAEANGLDDGELVTVSSRLGRVVVRARLSEGQSRGTLFVPMHWNDQFASKATVDSLVNPALDPISGQPEFKHTPVTIHPYRPAWHGFLLTRERVILEHASYWAKAKREGLWHYELAGEEVAENWSDLAKELLLSASDQSQWGEMMDRAAGYYRGVSVVDGMLQSCLFIGPDHRLPKRDWLVRLFARPQLTRAERMRLLAGVPGNAQEDAGKTVCACFGVGRNTLIQGIREDGLTSTDAIGERLKAGTNCGSCLSEIKTLIAGQISDSDTQDRGTVRQTAPYVDDPILLPADNVGSGLPHREAD
ncbi:MAG: nitrate reductase [gamma proteobacterium symbiont of Ctena orbiculata]|nr:MAG: nitrate reductase [gamma proteobacterium symbiont of Ctena orbiculata]PVV22746.1 MAG: nitrate reductase [gamma proteobacterium symbiont of Ctena orbiculata]